MNDAYTIYAIVIAVVVAAYLGLSHATRVPKPSSDNRTLVERHRDLIQERRNGLHATDRPHYIDDETKACITAIADREGRRDLSPRYNQWLSQWQARPDVPQEWLGLKDYIKAEFQARHAQLLTEAAAEKKRLENLKKQREDQEGQRFLQANWDLIEKFLEIAERKVSVIDDYGDENWDVLAEEISICIVKIARRKGVSDHSIREFKKRKVGAWMLREHYEWLRGTLGAVFREYHQEQKARPATTAVDGLSGVEFETYIARILRENGYDDVRGTPSTGDQGADLIAKRGGRTIIIQAKRYQGSVGNKAVQEVIGALAYYGGDEGWVITNATFTPSAKALAQKTNVRLIDGRSLADLPQLLSDGHSEPC